MAQQGGNLISLRPFVLSTIVSLSKRVKNEEDSVKLDATLTVALHGYIHAVANLPLWKKREAGWALETVWVLWFVA